MKKIIILICIYINVSAATEGGTNTLRVTQNIINLDSISERLSTEGGTNTLRTLGDFDYDSLTDRWILKTKSRILSVANIDLVDKFKDKQFEVEGVSTRMKRVRSNMSKSLIKRRILNKVKFENYIIDDFDY